MPQTEYEGKEVSFLNKLLIFLSLLAFLGIGLSLYQVNTKVTSLATSLSKTESEVVRLNDEILSLSSELEEATLKAKELIDSSNQRVQELGSIAKGADSNAQKAIDIARSREKITDDLITKQTLKESLKISMKITDAKINESNIQLRKQIDSASKQMINEITNHLSKPSN